MNPVDISIIIATRRRENILWETIDKACSAILGTNAELIVVNDDESPLDIPAKFQHTVRYFNNPKKGVSAARNYGALQSNGSILFFIDDDMWINREVINWINSTFNGTAKASEVYNINWQYPPSLTSKLQGSKIGKYILGSGYNTMWGRMHQNGTQPTSGNYRFSAVASCSLLMTKKTFNKLNGYNEKMIFQGEDIDLSNRLNALSIPIYCVFDVTLNHNHADRLEISSFLKRNEEGFRSEFNAIKSGALQKAEPISYRGLKRGLFDIFHFTEQGWLLLLYILPGNKFFTPLNNKLIGALGSLQKYKQWKNILA